ncbi:RICIN domain-containing protein [Kitasatospora sp. NPDC058032]|uniref:RICIN domain-containing protein n=1 Tax=Kitasatospora sp. NPDC058032 TaxID=3346307 RepID=UPI0036DCC4B7
MTEDAPARRRRLGAALGALATAAAAVVVSPGAAHAEQIPRYTLYFELRNAATGKCLEVADWRKDDGAPVRQWTCHGGANQLWTANSNGQLLNAGSSSCLDVPGSSTVLGTQLVIWGCHFRPSADNQLWSVPHVNRPSPDYVGSAFGVLDVYGFDPSDGAPVVTWGPNGGANQIWTGLETRVNF